MDRIIKSHVRSFQESSGLQDLLAEDAFEYFVNYCIGYKFTGTPFDTNGVTTDDPDAGIDGVIFHRKVKTTGFSRLALAAILQILLRMWPWNAITEAIQFTRSSITSCG